MLSDNGGNIIRRVLAIIVGAFVFTAGLAQDITEEIEVVGQTPLGVGIGVDRVAANAQSVSSEQIAAQRALDLADYMRRNLAGVFINEAQSNPLQPDVQYRGFVGSPLLGLSQGIAVYQDGARLNEPFGDTVNWAVIPDVAISRVTLMPGSNPLFGLNALGGAIAIETKNGLSHPGTRADFLTGSFGRLGLTIETGGSNEDGLRHYFAGNYLRDDGWRDFSPTDALQLFGDIGWEKEDLDFAIKLALADTDLIGNGPLPFDLLNLDRDAIFTRPDQTENKLAMVNLLAEHHVSDSLSLNGNLYVRQSDIQTLNGDDSDFEECFIDPSFLCVVEGTFEEFVVDQAGSLIAATESVEGATINRTSTNQDGAGISLQASWSGEIGGRENQFILGIAYDTADVQFVASTELGAFDATRFATPGGVFVRDSFTSLHAKSLNLGIYFAETIGLTEKQSLTIAGRLNDTEVKLRDQIGEALNGDHSFDRFNPSIAYTAYLTESLQFYAGYNESSRAPSPVELTCADDEDPCRLPNAFLSDPPLQQVVAETVEIGLRGSWMIGSEINRFAGRWHAGYFNTSSQDDILFISAGALTNEGFFSNIGRTRRRGFEFDVSGGKDGGPQWFANITLLEASFRDALTVPSAHNPAAIGGEVAVNPGDQIPLTPRSLLKTGLQLPVGPRLTIAGELYFGSDFYLRGDEGNDQERIGAHSTLNIRGDYLLSESLRIYFNFENVFDRQYATFGLFGDAEDVLGEGFDDPRFFSPATPRAVWVGLQAEF